MYGKISGPLTVLCRLNGCINTSTRRQVFNCFVKSRIMYCLPVWGQTALVYHNQSDNLLSALVLSCTNLTLFWILMFLTALVYVILNIMYYLQMLLFLTPCTRRHLTVLVLLNYYLKLKNVAHGWPRLIN